MKTKEVHHLNELVYGTNAKVTNIDTGNQRLHDDNMQRLYNFSITVQNIFRTSHG